MSENENQLVKTINEYHVEPVTAQNLQQEFYGYFSRASQLVEDAKAIQVIDESQIEDMARARELRLQFKEIRVETEKTRKRLKEDSLRKGKAIDGIANVIKYLVVPIEEHLEKQERFKEIREAERKQKMIEERNEQLSQYVDSPENYRVDEMTEEAFSQLLESVKIIHEKKIAEEKRIQAELEAKRKAEEDERKRIAEENIRLKMEKEEAEKKALKEAAEKAKLEAAIKAQQEKEREERERLEAEIRARKEAEAARIKAEEEERARLIAAEKAKEEEERKRPDKEKIFAYANSIEKIQLPDITNQIVIKKIEKAIINLTHEIKQFVEEL